MPADVFAQWRGSALPTPDAGHEHEPLEIEVGGIAVGGMLLDHSQPGGRRRTTVRLLETSLAAEDTEHWPAVLEALEAHARDRGTTTLTTAVPPPLLQRFQEAGWAGTMADIGVATGDRTERLFAVDERVRVRAMTAEERRRVVPEAREILRSGMLRAGVLADATAPMHAVDRRLEALVDDPPDDEVLITATVGGAPVGRFWGTLVPGTDGTGRSDIVANTIDLFPEHRGQGLMRPLMAALETYVLDHDLRDVRARLYARDHRARPSLVGVGVGIDHVHLRKDLDGPSG